jgi:hypothetical protein
MVVYLCKCKYIKGVPFVFPILIRGSTAAGNHFYPLILLMKLFMASKINSKITPIAKDVSIGNQSSLDIGSLFLPDHFIAHQ